MTDFNEVPDFDPADFEQITTDIFTWKDKSPGDFLFGVLEDIRPFTEGQFETDVNQYILRNKEGLVSTVLGSATDKQIKGVVEKGDKMYIEYHGKQALDDGRSVNKFKVMKAKNAS